MFWEAALAVFHFLAAVGFLALAIKSRSVSRQIFKRDDKLKELGLKEINPEYWFFKQGDVDSYFFGDAGNMATIMTTVNKLLEGELTRGALSLTSCQQSKDLELKLGRLMTDIVNRFMHRTNLETEPAKWDEEQIPMNENEKVDENTVACMLFQVTCFNLKKEMVEYMYDMKGYRRWRLAVSHLQKSFKNPSPSSSRTSTCISGISTCISRISTFIPKSFLCSCSNCDPNKSVGHFKPSLFTRVRLRLQMVVIPIGLIIWDNWSDGVVLYNYTNIWMVTNSSLLRNSTILGGKIPAGGGETPEISFAVILLSLTFMFSTLTFLTSIFGTSPSRALTQGLKTAEKMAEPQQTFDERDYWGFASRYQLTIAEASSESLCQQTVQWAAYFAISRLLANTLSGEYEEYLTFQALVSSGLASVTALTLCQVKTNAIFHEFTLSLSQKLAHTLASLVNTLAHSTLLVLICTIIFDLIFVIAAKTNFLWALLCLLQLFLLLPAIYLLTFFWGKSVTEENDLRAVRERRSRPEEKLLRSNAIRHTNYNKQVVRSFLYHAENLFCHLRLPTSVSNLANQPICYQTACDARTVLISSKHYFTLHLYFLLSCFLLVAQQLQAHLSSTVVAPTLEIFSARHNLLLVSFSLPFAFIVALLLLHLYFKGTFLCNNQYVGFPQTCWLDLGPVSFSLLSTFGLKTPQDVGTGTYNNNKENGVLRQQQ